MFNTSTVSLDQQRWVVKHWAIELTNLYIAGVCIILVLLHFKWLYTWTSQLSTLFSSIKTNNPNSPTQHKYTVSQTNVHYIHAHCSRLSVLSSLPVRITYHTKMPTNKSSSNTDHVIVTYVTKFSIKGVIEKNNTTSQMFWVQEKGRACPFVFLRRISLCKSYYMTYRFFFIIIFII